MELIEALCCWKWDCGVLAGRGQQPIAPAPCHRQAARWGPAASPKNNLCLPGRFCCRQRLAPPDYFLITTRPLDVVMAYCKQHKGEAKSWKSQHQQARGEEAGGGATSQLLNEKHACMQMMATVVHINREQCGQTAQIGIFDNAEIIQRVKFIRKESQERFVECCKLVARPFFPLCMIRQA